MLDLAESKGRRSRLKHRPAAVGSVLDFPVRPTRSPVVLPGVADSPPPLAVWSVGAHLALSSSRQAAWKLRPSGLPFPSHPCTLTMSPPRGDRETQMADLNYM